MKLRKDTVWWRRTTDQTGRLVVLPELVEDPTVDPSAMRHITLILPSSPSVAVAVGPMPDFEVDWSDPDPEALRKYFDRIQSRGGLVGVDDAGADPEDIASGRLFQWPQPAPGRSYDFNIRARQWVAVMAEESLANVSVIVEYVEEALG